MVVGSPKLGGLVWLAVLALPAWAEDPKRILVLGSDGAPTLARVHGQEGNELAVLINDGQLKFIKDFDPATIAYSEMPFVPLGAEAILAQVKSGPLAAFRSKSSAHYLMVYDCSEKFASDSLSLLETLYEGLLKTFAERGLSVRPAEFPLVAIVFGKESDFRARRQVEPSVQAYYEPMSNFIVFYEQSESEANNPEVAAMRKPQTVAHEGAHQVLHNIGVQARLAPWPIWLAEGMAEYCAPTTTKKDAVWAGMGKVNPIHMATIKDLNDPVPPSLQAMGVSTQRVNRAPGAPLAEHLVTRTELNAAEYALSWAMTHYLATKKTKEFTEYLKKMAALRPLERLAPEDHLRLFKEAFKRDLATLDKDVAKHLASLKYEELPYYAVMFQHPLPNGKLRRAGLVTQSPSVVRQQYEEIRAEVGDAIKWRVVPCPTRKRAAIVVEQLLAG